MSQLIFYVNGSINLQKILKKEKEEVKKKYPWLEQDDEREICQMEILNKYVDLDKSCLSDLEKNQVMDMLYNIKMHLG